MVLKLLRSSIAAIVFVLVLGPLSSSTTESSGGTSEPCPSALAASAGPELFAHGLFAGAAPADPCPRPAPGSVVQPPPDLYSSDGVLRVTFDYYTVSGSQNHALYCFRTPDGLELPTLHVRPGDVLDVTLRNRLPAGPGDSDLPIIAVPICGAEQATRTSVNLHYHGTNTSPACHADETIHTVVNPGQTFRYRLRFPNDEPPGLYWYHPHIYKVNEAAVQGGASGAIIVEGIEKLQPKVAGLPERVLIVRDQHRASGPTDSRAPAWDVSVNYVPVPYPNYPPAVIRMRPDEMEFWRVANAAADTILDIALQYDGVAQPLEVVALDGVPLNSQDGRRRGRTIMGTHILIPPAGRAEFIVTGPPATVRNAVFVTRKVATGPDGDNDPTRPLAAISLTGNRGWAPIMPISAGPPGAQRFEGLDDNPVTAHRRLYFSEINSISHFFITVDGDKPQLFEPGLPPAIITTQGSVEDWTIENQSLENHEFHIHQIHFELLERNGAAVPESERQFLDTIDIPYWSGSGPFPSATVRMDFRGLDVGDFVYHCHILQHADHGMVAIIRVLPKP